MWVWQSNVSTVCGEKSKIGTVRKTETDMLNETEIKHYVVSKKWAVCSGWLACDRFQLLIYLAAFLLLSSVRHPWILITYLSFFVRLECVLIIHDSQKMMMH